MYGDPALSYMLSKIPLHCTTSPAWALELASAVKDQIEIAELTAKLTSVTAELEEEKRELAEQVRWYGDHDLK